MSVIRIVVTRVEEMVTGVNWTAMVETASTGEHAVGTQGCHAVRMNLTQCYKPMLSQLKTTGRRQGCSIKKYRQKAVLPQK